MKRVLLVQPSLQPPGGGNGVAAWIIEALRREHEVSVLAWTPVDLGPVNRYYGTSLSSTDFAIHMPPAALRLLANQGPSLSLLKTSILLRMCKQMKDNYDVFITANNEAEFGRRGIQYIHYPWNYQPRPASELRWYHGALALRFYYRLCYRISDFSFERMKRNLTLVNSNWIGQKVREWHGIDSQTLYPPACGSFPEVSWNDRKPGFVCIGRIFPEKGLDTVIDIVTALRSRGVNTHLHIVGTEGDSKYYRHISMRVKANPSWLFLHENLPRKELAHLISRHKYGIHGMKEEHFGMAPAEMVLGGCIVFVPSGGGQMEIVAQDRLMYENVDDATNKISRVMGDTDLQNELRAHLAGRKQLFSTGEFTRRVREIVQNFGHDAE